MVHPERVPKHDIRLLDARRFGGPELLVCSGGTMSVFAHWDGLRTCYFLDRAKAALDPAVVTALTLRLNGK